METASDGTSTIHRLHERVLLVLLERKTEPEEEEYEVSMVFSSHVWHAKVNIHNVISPVISG